MENKKDLYQALAHAIQREEFVLYYQPQFNLENSSFDGVEALIRWQHPEKGLILPSEFIQQVDEANLITPLGEWVLRTACRQNKAWQDKGLLPIRIAVNVFEKQFLYSGFVSQVKQILKETQLNPAYLELELSENIIINDEDETIINAIKALKKEGIQIALDDFGTGFSSISYLEKIPVDRIKIDRTYIQNINDNAEDAEIVRSILRVASRLHLQVLAEGVETLLQLKKLMEQECPEVQGYYFSTPLSAEEVEKFLLLNQNRPS